MHPRVLLGECATVTRHQAAVTALMVLCLAPSTVSIRGALFRSGRSLQRVRLFGPEQLPAKAFGPEQLPGKAEPGAEPAEPLWEAELSFRPRSRHLAILG